MAPSYANPHYGCTPAPPTHETARHHLVVVGGGMVGLTMALEMARRGFPVVVLDEDDTVSVGSRAICFAKRTLEIFDRLSLGARMLEKGVTWNRGHVYFHDREIYAFDLLPEAGHQFPAFVNLQQYHAEEWLVEACRVTGLVELRWQARVMAAMPSADGVRLMVATSGGDYTLDADWLLACDGAHSTVREALALPFTGKVFHDRFLIADIVMQADFPAERRFWFNPPFHPSASVLLHRQPDSMWRIDFQLGWDADPEVERDPAKVRERVTAMLGPDIPFELEWVSVYTFRCRRLERFRHERVFFVGDSAHQVSPFGARGGNAGVQDADNLGWKLAAVLRGVAPDALLDSYDAERGPANDENIRASSRSTDFITPKNEAARAYRDATLELSATYPFARALVNSGRLSRPAVLADSPLSTPADENWRDAPPIGSAAPDAPIERRGRRDWLLRQMDGSGFPLLLFGSPGDLPPRAVASLCGGDMPVVPLFVSHRACDHGSVLHDVDGHAMRRFGAGMGAAILLRPDQHIAARWTRFDADAVRAARMRALAGGIDAALRMTA